VRVLRRLGLPAVTPHSARHWFISTLQAHGTEVGLVAKQIAGLSPEEIQWAIEELGRCDTEDFVIVENRDLWPGPFEK
jgi:hypothetical protein